MLYYSEELVSELRAVVWNYFENDSTGHDPHHLERVFRTAMQIQESEGGNKLVIACAAWLHDMHRFMQKRGGPYVDPKASLPRVEEILRDVGAPEDKIGLILHCVEFHEVESPLPAGMKKCRELAVIQDADMLDMLGAIGIARGFQFAGAHGYPIWIPEKPFDGTRDSNGRDWSEVHHFLRHTMCFEAMMNTAAGALIAMKRREVMRSFLGEFFREWSGEV